MDADTKLVPLVCPRCGADLDVPPELTVFRCSFCGSKVELCQGHNVRGLKLIEEGVRQLLQHTEATATGVDRLVQAREADEARRTAARESWQRELERHEAMLHVAQRRSRVYAGLSLASLCIAGPGLTTLLGYTVFAHIGVHILWPLLAGVAASFYFAIQHTGYRNAAKDFEQQVHLWQHRKPLD